MKLNFTVDTENRRANGNAKIVIFCEECGKVQEHALGVLYVLKKHGGVDPKKRPKEACQKLVDQIHTDERHPLLPEKQARALRRNLCWCGKHKREQKVVTITPKPHGLIGETFGTNTRYITRDELDEAISIAMLYELKDTGSCDSPEFNACIEELTKAVKEHNKRFPVPQGEGKKKKKRKHLAHDHRKGLKKFDGQRMTVIATVERFGTKKGWQGREEETILLKDVCLKQTGEKLCDHLWFTKGKSWDGTVSGCDVEFDARVTTYQKGYKGRRDDVYDRPVEHDYKLERPTKVVIKRGNNL